MIPRLSFALLAAALHCLAAADTLHLADGRSVEGELLGLQAGFILLQLPSDQGDAARRFDPEAVDRIAFRDHGRPLHRQISLRANLLGHLTPQDEARLLDFLDDEVAQTRYLAALAYAKLWHPKLEYDSHKPRSYQILIASARGANLPNEAVAHAERALSEMDPTEAPLLAWQTLAEHALNRDRPIDALRFALRPVAYAHAGDTDRLKPFYLLSADAYEQLGYAPHADAMRALARDANAALQLPATPRLPSPPLPLSFSSQLEKSEP